MTLINPSLKLDMRERFLRVYRYMEVDHIPDVEFGYWDATLLRWHREGLPSWVTDNRKADEYFGFEAWYWFKVPVIIPFKPFEERILEDRGETVLKIDSRGVVCLDFKNPRYGTSIPKFVSFPVKDWDSWESYKERFDLDGIRLPSNWESLKAEFENRDYPLGVDAGGYFGWARDLMGLEALCKAFYTQPELVRDMFEFRTEMTLRALRLVLKEVKVDYASWWEDMCYNRGPLISPRLFREFMVPQYKRVTGLLREHGCWLNIVDCDGDIRQLIPLWLEAGINCFFPLEVRAGSDPVAIREQYGRKALLMGGVDKTALIRGGKAIDEELRRVKPVVEDGGYIPHVDHRVPADVSYENYLYYLKKKRRLIGVYRS